jgi:hypothetical protein
LALPSLPPDSPSTWRKLAGVTLRRALNGPDDLRGSSGKGKIFGLCTGRGTGLKKIAVGTKPHEAERVGVRLHVDQEHIRPDVALAAIDPIPRQIMIPVMHRQRLVVRQHLKNRIEEAVNVFVAGI